MKVFFNFSVDGFSNTYLVGPDNGGDAIIIDPGTMNVRLLNLIETNNYTIHSALLTHTHKSHASGLKTLSKIYDFEIYAGAESALDFSCRKLTGGENLDISGMKATIISIQGHSADSLIFLIGNYMFTGDSFSAGTVGSTPNGYGRELLIGEIQKKIFSLGGNYLIFPGHGAPSTLEAERLTNPASAER